MSEKFREKQTFNRPQPDGLKFTSRYTAEYNGKIYDTRKLIDLAQELPVSELATSELDGMKGGKYWHDKAGKWLGPTEIIELYKQSNGDWDQMIDKNPDYADHIKAVRNADDEEYPILLVGLEDRAWVIDGMHRLTHAWIDEKKTIKIRRFEELPDKGMVSES